MKIKIEIDTYTDVKPEGIDVEFYVDDNDEPNIISKNWDEIIDECISHHTLLSENNPIVVDKNSNGVSEIIELIKTFRKVADNLSDKLLEKEIFLRDRWEEQGGDTKDHYVHFEEYLDHVNKDHNS
jgi:hypothetical protein